MITISRNHRIVSNSGYSRSHSSCGGFFCVRHTVWYLDSIYHLSRPLYFYSCPCLSSIPLSRTQSSRPRRATTATTTGDTDNARWSAMHRYKLVGGFAGNKVLAKHDPRATKCLCSADALVKLSYRPQPPSLTRERRESAKTARGNRCTCGRCM